MVDEVGVGPHPEPWPDDARLDPELLAGGEAVAAELEAQGLSVVLDDRKASPGVKFADAELIGVPTIVVVGRGTPGEPNMRSALFC